MADKAPSNSRRSRGAQLGRQASPDRDVLHPSQFQVNEAWIAFQLNDAPIETEQDGSFNCVALMDAASCFILGNEFVSTALAQPCQADLGRLFRTGWEHKKRYPATLFVPKGRLAAMISAEAARNEISVIAVEEDQLLASIGEARQGFRKFMQGRGDREG